MACDFRLVIAGGGSEGNAVDGPGLDTSPRTIGRAGGSGGEGALRYTPNTITKSLKLSRLPSDHIRRSIAAMPTDARRLRLILFHAQSGFCAGCGNKIRSKPGRSNDPLAPTFDHVCPRSKGGKSLVTNGLLKHRRCNAQRGDRPPTGCDRLWQIVVSARLKHAKSQALPEFYAERDRVRREELRAVRAAIIEAGRTVEGRDGVSYRLWGFVRLSPRCEEGPALLPSSS